METGAWFSNCFLSFSFVFATRVFTEAQCLQDSTSLHGHFVLSLWERDRDLGRHVYIALLQVRASASIKDCLLLISGFPFMAENCLDQPCQVEREAQTWTDREGRTPGLSLGSTEGHTLQGFLSQSMWTSRSIVSPSHTGYRRIALVLFAVYLVNALLLSS